MSVAGYTANTFTAGQQPTTSVWNELWSNDAAFNTFLSATNSVITGNMLAANAITLGYSQITSSQTTTSTSFTAVTGLTTTVTVPAGGRDVEISIGASAIKIDTQGAIWSVALYKDGSPLSQWYRNQDVAGFNIPLSLSCVDTAPTAGSHTYAVYFASDTSGHTVTLAAGTASSTPTTPSPAFILVGAI